MLSRLFPSSLLCGKSSVVNHHSEEDDSDGPVITPRQARKSTRCIFCNVSRDNGFDVVYEDAEFIAFRDYNPSSLHHLQVIPRDHIDSVKSLSRSDIERVRRMAKVGNSILDEWNVPALDRRLGFHIPPFNTVNHLHLHVQALPYKSRLRQMKYPISRRSDPYVKGFSWFVEVRQAIQLLERGKKITVSSC
ncbi:HIT-like protein [Coniophora puteana RWD-64-598 SS2]|uniref:HIT-like protein n=1 Tax=Coniophora puteana (strain RWD-64-598) TaxID=741705 RepID=A0A5M3MX69_CONPW|nr:HIT-like protein [Coniophora puteana RWD-64-598 SS2]EIW83688.1 HIT-like protein [Coniophora puteana RWD-64-598 SS2]